MKLLIVGSRSIKDFNLSQYIPKDTTLIVSGGANGIDTLAEQYADKYRISKLILRPRYDLYGKSAPLKRNDQMVDLADRVLVVWDSISKGSKHTIDYAKKNDKPLILILHDK